MGCVDHSPANNGELRVMTVVAGAAPTALWHTAHCVSQCGRLGVGLVVRVV